MRGRERRPVGDARRCAQAGARRALLLPRCEFCQAQPAPRRREPRIVRDKMVVAGGAEAPHGELRRRGAGGPNQPVGATGLPARGAGPTILCAAPCLSPASCKLTFSRHLPGRGAQDNAASLVGRSGQRRAAGALGFDASAPIDAATGGRRGQNVGAARDRAAVAGGHDGGRHAAPAAALVDSDDAARRYLDLTLLSLALCT